MISGVRIRYYTWACLAFAGSSPALARGGPSGALASALEAFLEIAILVGLVAGAVCALTLRRPPWKILVVLAAIALVVTVALPFAGMFYGLPALVSCAVFASVFHVMRGGVFHARAGHGETSGASDVLRWIAATYAFWVVVSLGSFELLGFLAIAPVALLSFEAIGRFLPFILPPLAVALLVGVFVTVLLVKRNRSRRHVAPLIFNACVLVSFFVSAEGFRYHLMEKSLRGHTPGHVERSTFLSSVLTYRTYGRSRHGGFEENGKAYRWSYAEREFVQLPPATPAPAPLVPTR